MFSFYSKPNGKRESQEKNEKTDDTRNLCFGKCLIHKLHRNYEKRRSKQKLKNKKMKSLYRTKKISSRFPFTFHSRSMISAYIKNNFRKIKNHQ